MSIPPLVCSTPPPPDQCDDDKDPEDFDLPYNLSQEDDNVSNEYDYGNFATYNNFESSISTSSHVDIPVINSNQKNEDAENKIKNIVDPGTNITNGNRDKSEEENNIEDLNLRLDEVVTVTDSPSKDGPEECVNQLSAQETNIPDIPSMIIEDNVDHSSSDTNECNEESDNLDSNVIKPEPDTDISEFDEVIQEDTAQPGLLTDNSQKMAEGDFDEFDDFQFINPDINQKINVVDNTDNPWDSEPKNTEFGEFKANFDDSLSNTENTSVVNSESDDKLPKDQSQKDDDDFGEFDDFQSSAKDPLDAFSCPDINLESSDSENQVIESINKILSTIFEHEIPKPETEFDGKLESYLSETWGHLIDMDVRQPYMVNWNSALGQKVLLKALCIDSRNILFGPKWNYNMPKYAVNLSNAPLQPQKQASTPGVSQSDSVSLDKSSQNSNTTWTDPFASEGQESRNTETEASSPIVSVPTDLEVFEATISTKSDKVYPTTLNVQPMRQINLPDTHIFTPTDSETPRSKTIHYDSSPSVLLSQPVLEHKNVAETISPQPEINSLENDNEYWEFQDFKSSAEPTTSDTQTEQRNEVSAESTKHIQNTTYQTELLQPVKVNPSMPTLNWPAPGEVKDTFDDFSEFVSNLSWSTEKQDTTMVAPVNVESLSINHSENICAINPNNDTTMSIESTTKAVDNLDDEFDTFQSALPKDNITNSNQSTSAISQSVTHPQISTGREFKMDVLFPQIENVKSESIIFSNSTCSSLETQNQTALSSNNLTNSLTMQAPIKTSPKMTPRIPVINTNILQPTIATNVAQNQKSTQILQPLSLESYSKINWPNPGIDLQDLSRFNPVETLPSLKNDLSGSTSKSSPMHSQKVAHPQGTDEDIWGDFVSSKPKQSPSMPKKQPTFCEDDEWTDFVSSPAVKPQNGLNTISLNVHTNLNMHHNKTSNLSKSTKNNQSLIDIPSLNYVTSKSRNHNYSERHFQNL